jgi:hypothetical protein
MRMRALLFCTILLIAVRNTPATQTPQDQDTYRPTATIKDIMVTMVDPSADYIWESVGTEVSAAGIVNRSPQTDKEWSELRTRTLMLIEATNLLAIPGRHVAKAGEKPAKPQVEMPPEQIEALINMDRTNWVNLSHGLHDVSMQALAAVDAKNVSALLGAGAKIDQACENCHVKYWYLPAR